MADETMTCGGKALGLAVVGVGFAGRLHARSVFHAHLLQPADAPALRLVAVADRDLERAHKLVAKMPSVRVASDWTELADDPAVDAAVISLPNDLHAPAARAFLAAGKPVLVEKPMAAELADALEIAAMARSRGTAVAVGYVFLTSPAVAFARDLVAEGALGEPIHLVVRHAEDYGAGLSCEAMGWRGSRAVAGFGALGDLGAHAIAVARALCGPIARVTGMLGWSPDQRSDGKTEDVATSLLEFAAGAHGCLQASRVALGRKMHLTFELTGTKGSLQFDHERPNEIAICRGPGRGFETLLIGPDQPYYGAFLPAAGHGLGFADLFTIQMAAWTRGLAGGPSAVADSGFALEVEAALHAIARSASQGGWVSPAALLSAGEELAA